MGTVWAQDNVITRKLTVVGDRSDTHFGLSASRYYWENNKLHPPHFLHGYSAFTNSCSTDLTRDKIQLESSFLCKKQIGKSDRFVSPTAELYII